MCPAICPSTLTIKLHSLMEHETSQCWWNESTTFCWPAATAADEAAQRWWQRYQSSNGSTCHAANAANSGPAHTWTYFTAAHSRTTSLATSDARPTICSTFTTTHAASYAAATAIYAASNADADATTTAASPTTARWWWRQSWCANTLSRG